MRASSQRRGRMAGTLAIFAIAGCAPASPVGVATATTVTPVREDTSPPASRELPIRVVKQIPLTPAQESSLAEVTTQIEAASRAYKVPPPRVTVYDRAGDSAVGNPASGIYLGLGHIMLSVRTLMSPGRDAVVAHEMGHYVLRHADRTRSHEEKEREASIEAVRILEAAKVIGEEDALREVLTIFQRHRLSTGGAPAGEGHGDVCAEIRAVIAAYPRQRGWSSAFDCAPRGG